jgi:hypothetical protein
MRRSTLDGGEANPMTIRNGLFAAAAAAVVLFPGPAAVRAERPDAGPGSCPGVRAVADSRPACCFTNPQYSGTCAAEPGKDETCVSILEYLNNPRSQGKTYCENTSIRGGWKQAECAKKSGSATADPRPGP